MRRLVVVSALALLLGGGTAGALRLPGAPRCPIFPAGNAWNERVSSLVAQKVAEALDAGA